MICDHYSNHRSPWVWNNFTAKELSCSCCGEYYHCRESLFMLQKARDSIGKPLRINSAHRCVDHNKAVHGAKSSEHLRIAFDVSLRGHDKEALLGALFSAGFTTFGLYESFIHTDIRPYRLWFGCEGVIKKEWQVIYDKVVKAV